MPRSRNGGGRRGGKFAEERLITVTCEAETRRRDRYRLAGDCSMILGRTFAMGYYRQLRVLCARWLVGGHRDTVPPHGPTDARAARRRKKSCAVNAAAAANTAPVK